MTQKADLAKIINYVSIDRILAFDTDKNIIAWNHSCELLSGRTKRQVMGKTLYEVCPEIAENKVIARAINGALNGHRMFITSENGSCLGGYHDSHFIPLKNDDDIIIGVLCLMHDVAHRVKTEQELKSLNRALAKKNKELKDKNDELLAFSQVTGHDLKEPLRKIYTFIEMILGTDAKNLTDTGKSHFKRVQSSVQRMGMLTDDLLRFSQVGSAAEAYTEIDLNNILTVAKYNLKNTIDEKNAVITSANLPAIKGYRTLLTELFQRLIDNSLKFQHAGNIPIINITFTQVSGNEIKDAAAVANTTYVCLKFSDNGIGFEKKYNHRIFRMFQRLHSKGAYGGTGIGLASCKKIMDIHNGIITADSVPGNGSTFCCYFPQNN